jgi:hypothetical protein
MQFAIVGRFVDRTGQSAHSDSCGVSSYIPNYFSLHKVNSAQGGFNDYMSPFTAIFDFGGGQTEIPVSAKGVSLDRAKYFVAVGVLVDRTKVMTSMLEGYVGQQSVCALLDEAVRMRQLIGFDDLAGTLR